MVYDNEISKIETVFMCLLYFEVPSLQLSGWMDKNSNSVSCRTLSRRYKLQLPEQNCES